MGGGALWRADPVCPHPAFNNEEPFVLVSFLPAQSSHKHALSATNMLSPMSYLRMIWSQNLLPGPTGLIFWLTGQASSPPLSPHPLAPNSSLPKQADEDDLPTWG